jgi:hypothetical protein
VCVCVCVCGVCVCVCVRSCVRVCVCVFFFFFIPLPNPTGRERDIVIIVLILFNCGCGYSFLGPQLRKLVRLCHKRKLADWAVALSVGVWDIQDVGNGIFPQLAGWAWSFVSRQLQSRLA